MRLETHEQGSGTSVAVHSLEQPSPRRRSATPFERTGSQPNQPPAVPARRRPPTVMPTRLESSASGTFSPRVSGPRPGRPGGRSNTSGIGTLDECRPESVPVKRRTSRKQLRPTSCPPETHYHLIPEMRTQVLRVRVWVRLYRPFRVREPGRNSKRVEQLPRIETNYQISHVTVAL